MKANEFIKKYGIAQAKSHAEILQEVQINGHHQEYIDDLKRLIESHDQVERLGGLEKARMVKDGLAFIGDFDSALSVANNILDVESCQ